MVFKFNLFTIKIGNILAPLYTQLFDTYSPGKSYPITHQAHRRSTTMGKTVDNPKKYIISCRINDEELQVLQNIAKQSDVSISTLLRQSLLAIQENLGCHSKAGAQA